MASVHLRLGLPSSFSPQLLVSVKRLNPSSLACISTSMAQKPEPEPTPLRAILLNTGRQYLHLIQAPPVTISGQLDLVLLGPLFRPIVYYQSFCPG